MSDRICPTCGADRAGPGSHPRHPVARGSTGGHDQLAVVPDIGTEVSQWGSDSGLEAGTSVTTRSVGDRRPGPSRDPNSGDRWRTLAAVGGLALIALVVVGLALGPNRARDRTVGDPADLSDLADLGDSGELEAGDLADTGDTGEFDTRDLADAGDLADSSDAGGGSSAEALEPERRVVGDGSEPRAGSNGEAVSAAVNSEASRLRAARERAGETSAGETTGSGGAGDTGFPPSDDHLQADLVAGFFESWVDDHRTWTVAYPSPMGLQLLSAAGVHVPTIEVAVGFEEAARLPIMSDGGQSWAVDPARTDVAYLVSARYEAIDVDREGLVGFINDGREPPNIGESSFGAWGPGFDVPRGSDVLAVQGRGLFVLPPTGGTYEYVLHNVEQFSPDRLVAASLDSEVLQRCDAELHCSLYAQGPDVPGGTVDLDIDVSARVWISPGGRWIYTTDEAGVSYLHDLHGTRLEVHGEVQAVDWSDDGSRAAVMTDDELLIFRADQGQMRSTTLPIQASAPTVMLVSN